MEPNNHTAYAIIFDTETHSNVDPKVIETAYMRIDPVTLKPIQAPVVQRFNPGVRINFGAMAAHHILPHELEGMPPSESFSLPEGVRYVIGHKIDFDLQAIGNPPGIKAIDTLDLARAAWPNCDGYSQSALFYMIHAERGLSLEDARETLKSAHSAGTDIQINALILEALLEHYQPLIEQLPCLLGIEKMAVLDALHILTKAAKIPLVMGFGKHAGIAPWDVPESYKSWYLNLPDADPNYIIAMTKGGKTPEQAAIFQTAQRIFGQSLESFENSPNRQKQRFSV